MIRIVIADGHALFREGLRKILEQEQDFKTVAETDGGEEALTLVSQYQPDVLLLEAEMPGLDGVHLVEQLKARGLRAAPVVVTGCEDEVLTTALLRKGALGFVLKSSGRYELCAAIRVAARGQTYVDPRAAGRLLTHRQERQALDDLSPREKETLYWLSQGYNNLEMAHRMLLSEKTVKNHISHLLKKLELRDRTQAAVLAWKLGFAQMTPEAMERAAGVDEEG